ncbi:MAG: hydroxyacylglutathione hydrolase [Gammaproteobacteria bacterium]|nr:hydroxyacylglutathione hydrolase [Gammaproteobacteria bacterium]
MNTITYVNALKDNYIWLILSEDKSHAIAIDPGEAEPVLQYLEQHRIKLGAILLTHHHNDHTSGVSALAQVYQPEIFAFSKQTCPITTHEIRSENSIFLHTHKLKFAILKTPGHTQDAICFFDGRNLFSGDTLFAGGCGRLFEGTAEQMFNSLSTLAALPDYTNVYCGHEYTLANLQFALSLEPNNAAISKRLVEVQSLRDQQLPSLPSTIGLEKKINPFLRCNDSDFSQHIAKQLGLDAPNPLELFVALRHFKDNWSL